MKKQNVIEHNRLFGFLLYTSYLKEHHVDRVSDDVFTFSHQNYIVMIVAYDNPSK